MSYLHATNCSPRSKSGLCHASKLLLGLSVTVAAQCAAPSVFAQGAQVPANQWPPQPQQYGVPGGAQRGAQFNNQPQQMQMNQQQMPVNQQQMNQQTLPAGSDASIFDAIKPDASSPSSNPQQAKIEVNRQLNVFDVTNGKFDKLEVNLTGGQSPLSTVDRFNFVAQKLDMKQGSLQSLAINAFGGRFQDFVFDSMTMSTTGDMHFDPQMLLNQRILQFATPAEAEITAVVTQESLNQWLSASSTLDRLSVNASKKIGILASMMGGNGANFGIKLSDASCVFGKANRVAINVTANVGMNGFGVPLPLTLDTKLGLADGWLEASDTHLNSNGKEISPGISKMLVDKINNMAEWGKKSDDIQFSFTDLRVVPNKQFVIKGTAKIIRLRFNENR